MEFQLGIHGETLFAVVGIAAQYSRAIFNAPLMSFSKSVFSLRPRGLPYSFGQFTFTLMPYSDMKKKVTSLLVIPIKSPMPVSKDASILRLQSKAIFLMISRTPLFLSKLLFWLISSK